MLLVWENKCKMKIFSFFGYECDFDKNSSILDKVIAIAEFGNINEYIYLI